MKFYPLPTIILIYYNLLLPLYIIISPSVFIVRKVVYYVGFYMNDILVVDHLDGGAVGTVWVTVMRLL